MKENVNFSVDYIIKRLKSLSNPKGIEGMARYGINPDKNLGVSIPDLRQIAREIEKNHQLANELWATGIHDARILAGMIGQPDKVTEKQMEQW